LGNPVPSQAGHSTSDETSLDVDFFINSSFENGFYRLLQPENSTLRPFVAGGKVASKVAIWSQRVDAFSCRHRESSMSKAGLDNRHRNHDGEISHKHGNTLIGTLRKIYGQSFAAGYPAAEKLSEVLLQLNETSLSQLRRDHETGHLEHKIAKASK
jgi:hypothetical protein